MGETTVDELYRKFLIEEFLITHEYIRNNFEVLLENTGYGKRLPEEIKVTFYSISRANTSLTKNELVEFIKRGDRLDSMGVECFGRWVSLLGIVASFHLIDGSFIDYLNETPGGVRGNYPLMVESNPRASEDLILWAKLQ